MEVIVLKGKYTTMKDKEKSFFHLIPQAGVTHQLCLDDPKHNAIWDMAVSPEGRIFFSVCGESYDALYARLYEYDRKNKSFVRHMELEKQILMSPHALRTSKFHTALSFMGDGKILTATHTTSPAPTHPTWMPYEFAEHPYEGYPGSDLLIYDYENKVCRGLGRISPHDTVYGATYDPKNGDYLAITWMRGTGYVYNVHTGDIRCLGQISDTHTSRTFLCSDGHIYGTTYTGAMFRYNTDKRDIEWLGVDAHGLIRHAREMDGKLYYTTGPCSVPGRGQDLWAYDFKENKVERIGRPVPKAEPLDENDKETFYNAYGMAFDSKKRLWYGCMTFTPKHRYVGARLYMWDFLSGKEPVDCGFLGTPLRTLSITAEMHIVDDVLYISDGNHTSDVDTPCGILEIELDKFVPALETEERIFSHDYVNYIPYQEEASKFYPKNDFDECMKRYDKYFNDTVLYFDKFLKDNAYRHAFAGTSAISVWEALGRGKAPVKKIEWTSNEDFVAFVGENADVKVVCNVKDGKASLVKIEKCIPANVNELKVQVPAVALPAVAGRRYLATAESSVALKNGKILVGTRDSMLAIIDGEKVFSLGNVASLGGIHSLVADQNGKVYGVAGHPLGVGQIFSYTEENGIELLGLVPEVTAQNGRNAAIYRPSTLAISGDGKYLAIGGADEMGGIVILTL